MRYYFLVLFTLMCFCSFSQTEKELAQHRLQYKIDLHNNIKADTSKVDFFPFKKKFIITAKAEMLKDQPSFQMMTSSGMKKEAQKFVKITFRYKGKRRSLIGYQLTKLKESADYADHFFIPFKDASTGKATYASGRYLDFKAGDIKDGELVIDFNKAYNPYCAFTDGYNCPIPPKENTLKFSVNAGEKKYKANEPM